MDSVDLEELLNKAVQEISNKIDIDQLMSENNESKSEDNIEPDQESVPVEQVEEHEPVEQVEEQPEPVEQVEQVEEPVEEPVPVQESVPVQEPIEEPVPVQEPVEEPVEEPVPVEQVEEQEPVEEQDSGKVDSDENKLDVANMLELLKNANVSDNDTIKQLMKNFADKESNAPLPSEIHNKFKELATLLKVYKPVVVDKVKGSNETPKDLADVARHTMGFFLEKVVDMLDDK